MRPLPSSLGWWAGFAAGEGVCRRLGGVGALPIGDALDVGAGRLGWTAPRWAVVGPAGATALGLRSDLECGVRGPPGGVLRLARAGGRGMAAVPAVVAW